MINYKLLKGITAALATVFAVAGLGYLLYEVMQVEDFVIRGLFLVMFACVFGIAYQFVGLSELSS